MFYNQREVIESIIVIKKAAAITNSSYGRLPNEIKTAICDSIDLIVGNDEILESSFPLLIWQTGSGTQTNMNVNEVIANHANLHHFKQQLGAKKPVHPNDHVNMSQVI